MRERQKGRKKERDKENDFNEERKPTKLKTLNLNWIIGTPQKLYRIGSYSTAFNFLCRKKLFLHAIIIKINLFLKGFWGSNLECRCMYQVLRDIIGLLLSYSCSQYRKCQFKLRHENIDDFNCWKEQKSYKKYYIPKKNYCFVYF